MVDADDPRRHDRPDRGEPVEGSDVGEELDVFTGDPVDALFDFEMSGEADDDTDAEESAHGLGEVAEFSVDARSGEELPPELIPPPAPAPADPASREPFELELLDPTDPGITREDLEGFEDEPTAELPLASDEEPAPPAAPAPDDPYAALAAIVGDDDGDDEWDADPDPLVADPPVEGRAVDGPAADEPALDEPDMDGPDMDGPATGYGADPAGAGGVFDGVPSASTDPGDDDRYAWLYDESVEPPPAFAERYLPEDEPGSPEPATDRPTGDGEEVLPPAAAPSPAAPMALDLPEPEPVDVEPDVWASPGEPDDETRIVDLAPADSPAPAGDPAPGDPFPEGLVPGSLLPEDLAPEDLAPEDLVPEDLVPEDLVPEDLVPEDLVPDPDRGAVGPDGAATDTGSASEVPETEMAPEMPEPGEPAGADTDDPFALAGSIFDEVEPEAHETDWESFTGEHILSSTQEYVGLAEELTRAEPPSEQMAISAGIPGLETSLVGLDDVAGEPPEAVVDTGSRRDLGLRILSGFGLLALFAISLVWSPAAAGFAVVVLVAAVGEFYAVLVANGRHPLAAFGLAGVAGCTIGTWVWGLVAVPVSLTVTLVAVVLFVATSAPRPTALEDTALTMLGVAWIGGLGAFALPIITAPDYRWLIAGVVAVVAALDIGQYFVGRKFGSRPLAPVLSPKKTIEGLIGGAIVTLLVGVLLSFLGPFDRMSALLLAAVAIVLGPLGDLSVSMVKRILAVKDMGTVLPGHGGILDRIDALLFVIPAAWVVLRATGLLA